MIKKAPSSGSWLARNRNDYFTKLAKKQDYRSRAVYKLLEIINKKHFIKLGDYVLDLGAYPGSWSQLAAKYVGPNGKVIANDITPIKAISKVEFIVGDFREQVIYDKITATIYPKKFDVILSDMAPNMSGHLTVDIPKSLYLAELALEIAINNLKPNGYFYIKLFQGSGFDVYVKRCKEQFSNTNIIKPKASRLGNKEVYLFAKSLK